MPRPPKSGLNVARRTRADGTIVEYFYDRKTKAPLGKSRAVALKKRGQAAPPPADEHTLAWLIDRFWASPKHQKKWAEGTKKNYKGYLDRLRDDLGHLRFKDIGPVELEELQIAFQDQPRKCNHLVGLLRQMFNYALRLKLLTHNPLAKPGMLPTAPRIAIWSEEDEAAFLAQARPRLRFALALMLYTCQRLSDVLALTKGQVTEREVNGVPRLMITLRQEKTNELVSLLVHQTLDPLLRERLAETDKSLMLVASPHGLQWTRRNFSRAWDVAATTAKLKGRVQRRDLRRTGVVRLAAKGATVPLLASVTGWSVNYTQTIVDTYLPRRTELAVEAMLIWESAALSPQAQTVVKLPARRA